MTSYTYESSSETWASAVRFLRSRVLDKPHIVRNQVRLASFIFVNRNVDVGLRSWIGSMQVMLVLSLGLFTGQLYDRGYLYAPISPLFFLEPRLSSATNPQPPPHDRGLGPIRVLPLHALAVPPKPVLPGNFRR